MTKKPSKSVGGPVDVLASPRCDQSNRSDHLVGTVGLFARPLFVVLFLKTKDSTGVSKRNTMVRLGGLRILLHL